MMRIVAALLLALAGSAFAGINFDGTTNAGATVATAEVTGTAMTICLYGQPTTTNVAYDSFGLADNTTAFLDIYYLRFNASAQIEAGVGHTGSYTAATTTGTYTANVWNLACARFISSSSRYASLNGTLSTQSTASVGTVTGINQTSVGELKALAGVDNFSGDLAEVGVWNVDLDANSFGMINSGYAPPCVQRGNLVMYYQMLAKQGSTLPDFFSDTHTNLTLGSGTSTSTGVSHPHVINCQ